jgi:hypothetical protein
VKREAIEGFIDLALRDGRIGAGQREIWTRMFEADATSAFHLLLERDPDPGQAQRNFWALDDNERKYRELEASLLGVQPEKVI